MTLVLKEVEKIIQRSKNETLSKISRKIVDSGIKQGDFIPNSCVYGIDFSVLVVFPLKEKPELHLTANYRRMNSVLSQYNLRLRGRDIIKNEGERSEDCFGYFGGNSNIGSYIAVNPSFRDASEILEKLGRLYGMSRK